MLFPPALEYACELYKSGKPGIILSNKELFTKYKNLNSIYQYPVKPSLIVANSFVNSQISKIKKLREPIDVAVNNNDYDYIIQEIENGNVYAEYVFERYFLKKNNLKNSIEDITGKFKHKDFTDYLIAFAYYKHYDEQENTDKEKIQIFADKIMDIAKKGNMSAVYRTGYWKMEHMNNTCGEDKDSRLRAAQEGVRLLTIAANHLYHPALYALGYNYYKGYYPLKEDKKLAKYYLTLTAAFDAHDDWFAKKAKEILSKMENPQQSSATGGCFITSAVCQSFGKPDDCYELTSFRSFRDNWLSKQEDGAGLIKEYYKIAPVIVKNIDSKSNSAEIYNNIWNSYLKNV